MNEKGHKFLSAKFKKVCVCRVCVCVCVLCLREKNFTQDDTSKNGVVCKNGKERLLLKQTKNNRCLPNENVSVCTTLFATRF